MKELLPKFGEDQARTAINQLVRGATNAVKDIELDSPGLFTVIQDENVSPSSRVFFTPLTASAAAELAAGTMFVSVSDIGYKTFTITHAMGASGRIFSYTLRTGE